jgi:hypothetical protein
MGVSTDAYLYFGFDIHDSEEHGDIRSLLGVDDDDDDDFDPYDYIETKLKNAGVVGIELDTHCHSDYPVYFLHSCRHSAWRGDSKELSRADLEVMDGWLENLEKACSVLGIPHQKPSWRLASYWDG